MRTTGDECFGDLARPVPPGAYLTMVRQLTRFDDMADCFDGSRDFYRLFDAHDLWKLSVERDVATLAVRPRTHWGRLRSRRAILMSHWCAERLRIALAPFSRHMNAVWAFAG